MDNHTPTYEPDDEPLTAKQIALIQSLSNVPANVNWDTSLLDMTDAEYLTHLKQHGHGINPALDAYLDKE